MTDYDALDLDKELRDPTKRFIFQGSSEFAVDLADAIRDLRAERDALQVQIVEERGQHREFELELLSRAAQVHSDLLAERDSAYESLRRGVPEGYVLVPREPTVAMRMPWHRQGGLRHASFYQKWKAMLAAVEKDRAALAAQEKP